MEIPVDPKELKTLREIVNKGIDCYEVDGHMIFYDLDHCSRRLRELERAAKRTCGCKSRDAWWWRNLGRAIAIGFFALSVVCCPLLGSYLLKHGPSWLSEGSLLLTGFAWFVVSVFSVLFIACTVEDKPKEK